MERRNPPDVVAVIVNYNGAELTARAVASLRSLDPGSSSLEVLVVDSASSSADLLNLRRLLPSCVTVLELSSNRGYGAACNAGIKYALEEGARAVWCLNNDVVVERDCLELLIASLEGSPDTAAVMPAVVSIGKPEEVISGGTDIIWWKVAARRRRAPNSRELPVDPYLTEAIEGSAVLISARALIVIGGFDEAFFMYWEDTEWSVRATRNGFRLMVVPKAVVQHEDSATADPASKVVWMFRNRYRFARLFSSGMATAWLTVYLFLGWLPAFLLGRVFPHYGLRGMLSIGINCLRSVTDDLRRFGFRPRQVVAQFSLPPSRQPVHQATTGLRIPE